MELDLGVSCERSYPQQWLNAVHIFKDIPDDFEANAKKIMDVNYPAERAEEVGKEVLQLVDDGWEILFKVYENDLSTLSFWLFSDGVVAHIDNRSGNIKAEVYSANEDSVDRYIDDWRERFEKYKETEEDVVELFFTYYEQSRGAVSTNSCQIKVPIWTSIRENYVDSTKDKLDGIFEGLDLDEGKMVIWYGDTGTGKTYALRSYMRDLKEEFNFYYITDPDVFMKSPDYYYKLSSKYEDMKSLFIFEDCANYLIPESRKGNESGISKVLNITDGLIGQGSEDLFLFTFNEDRDKLDDAIIRPGRCNEIVKFVKFSYDQAVEWSKENGYNVDRLDSGKEYTLAELYAGNEDSDSEFDSISENVGF